MTPRERAESVINVWPSYDSWKDEEASMLAFVEAVIADAVEADRADRVVSDIHGVALANVSGALVDSGVVVPEDETRYGEAVRQIVRERDEAIWRERQLSENHATMHGMWVKATDELNKSDRRIAELEAALRDVRGVAYDVDELHCRHVVSIVDAALSPTPAQPATAKEWNPSYAVSTADCAGCAKVARHPGDGYVCILHYARPAAPPSPAATKEGDE